MGRTRKSRRQVDEERKYKAPVFVDQRDQVALWTLRTLSLMKKTRNGHQLFADDDVLTTAGIESIDNYPGQEESSRSKVAKTLKEIETHTRSIIAKGIDRSDVVFENVATVGNLLDLTSTERELLAFVVLANSDKGLYECAEAMQGSSVKSVAKTLSKILDVGSNELKTALEPRANLLTSGILEVTRDRHSMPINIVDDFDEVMMREHVDENSLLGFFFTMCEPGPLTLDDFPHLSSHLAVMCKYLARAVSDKITGVNVLLHGPPGTGKTDLARALAANVGATLHAVEVKDSTGDWIRGERRLTSYLVCQKVLENRPNTAVLFDETEDVFSSMIGPHSILYANPLAPTKGRVNLVLEENPTPAIWTTNNIRSMDPAFVRRFDYVLKLEVPPKKTRRRILDRHLGELGMDEAWMDELSCNESITPADMEKAARIARICNLADLDEIKEGISRSLESSLTSRRRKLKRTGYRHDRSRFDRSLLNTNANMDTLIAGLKSSPSGAICMHGPPGTGKTAFAHHLADSLGMTIVRKTGSQLISMWLGGTEQNIARMFEQADPTEEIILLDEADSFFRSRELAQRSWEVTEVNELLVQMESYDGLFICSTNLIDNFDPAAFRRFSIKIKFGYMTTEQRVRMSLTATFTGTAISSGFTILLLNLKSGGLDSATTKTSTWPITSKGLPCGPTI